LRQEIYIREPVSFHGSIPVFSVTNEYTENYEQISDDHLKSLWQNGINPWIPEDLWVQMENSTVELVKKYSEPGDMILDVGVGLGRLLSHFPHLQRYGMDISVGYLEQAQAKGIEVSYAMVEDMPYKEEMFDIVVCTDVLEHVLDLNLCIKRILSVLQPKGTLIVRVPLREDLATYLATGCNYKFVHLRNFDEYSLRFLFERIMNCKIIETAVAAYIPSASRLKYRLVFPLLDRITARFFWEVRRFWGNRFNNAILKVLFYPAEINCVIRK
jgi:ubiquinone/menaquinone biosynthesis C-methylase UbiE